MADPASYRPDSIPNDPGVYRFFDQDDRIIYVGKAKSLRNRLSSYFQGNLTEKTRRMVCAAVRVDWTVVRNEVEALQLEFTWIKEESPHFNVQFRDDKSYPYLALSIKDEFPRLFITRSKISSGAKLFGPYTHAWALKSTFEVIQKVFPIRSCSRSNFEKAKKTKRACLLGDIGKCSAPCVGWITKNGHDQLVTQLVEFLEKGPKKVIDQLEAQMEEASAGQEYERAAKIRDQIGAVNKAQESTEATLSNELTLDVFARHDDITHSAVSWFTVRNGRITGSRSWIIDMKDVPELSTVLDLIIQRIYFENLEKSANLIPAEILVSDRDVSFQSLEDLLSNSSSKKVEIKVPARGEKVELVAMAKRSAHQSLVQFLSKRAADSAVAGGALEEIAEVLDLPEIPLRIECFDISNIQGTNIVASMVVFEDGQPKKSEYRRFAITDPAIRDDFSSMAHVITRRFKRYLLERDIDLHEIELEGGQRPRFAYPPQLIIVDGGKGQVSAAHKALNDLGISGIALVGLAKRMEEVFLPENSQPVIFDRHSEALYLFQRIRDEAHRFAITFHRSKRSKLMLESLLDEISALGEVRKRALMDRFGSVAALRKVEASEIAKTPGIGPRIASLIADHLASLSSTVLDTQTGEIKDS
ncbi:MAG: excinuclease ABC subunit UvrC [Actinomycetota bacterium]|nr:excinuclease ABC subunit UvrC [Actinomycetota bacterium]